jgi:hypothetical protein
MQKCNKKEWVEKGMSSREILKKLEKIEEDIDYIRVKVNRIEDTVDKIYRKV